MHELSIVMSLVKIIQQELEKHGAMKLFRARVRYGVLANVMPEALTMAFTATVSGTSLEGAVLELEVVPLVVVCSKCEEEFAPEHPELLFMPCPACGDAFGHRVLSGKELYLDYLEAE
ncbi:Hydrogenase maturation factor HypA 1 [Desulfovibrionales bacterium]